MSKKETENKYYYDEDEGQKKNEKIYIVPFKKFSCIVISLNFK